MNLTLDTMTHEELLEWSRLAFRAVDELLCIANDVDNGDACDIWQSELDLAIARGRAVMNRAIPDPETTECPTTHRSDPSSSA